MGNWSTIWSTSASQLPRTQRICCFFALSSSITCFGSYSSGRSLRGPWYKRSPRSSSTMFRMRKLPGRFKTKNKILLSNMKVICRPTAGRRDQSANHFLPKKMHSLISDTKICGHLPSHRKQTAFPSTQPRIKKETSATSRFPNYTVVQTDRSM